MNRRKGNRYVFGDPEGKYRIRVNITQISATQKTRLTVMAAFLNARDVPEDCPDSKTTITVNKMEEQECIAYVEKNFDSIWSDLMSILIKENLTQYKKLRDRDLEREVPTFKSFFDKNWKLIERDKSWADSTDHGYLLTVKNKLAPLLNDKPMCLLTYEDYENAVETLCKMYQIKGKDGYSQSRLNDFWLVLKVVADAAYAQNICPSNPIREHKRGFPINPYIKIRKERIQRKSLNNSETAKAVNAIADSLLTDGRVIGTALQLYAGLRPAEACGLNFRDVKPFEKNEERYYLRIYTQVRLKTSTNKKANTYTCRLKTKNGYRYIPVVKELQKLIEAKKTFLSSLGFSDEIIDTMPIVSKYNSGVKYNNDALTETLNKRCNSTDLSKCGKDILQHSLIKNVILNVPFEDDKITEDGEATAISSKPIESDPQAYEFRRNFATRMFGICGMSTTDVQYLMGHALEYDLFGRPNDYVNEENLLKLLRKMECAVSVSDNQDTNANELASQLSMKDPRDDKENITLKSSFASPVIMKVEDAINKHLIITPSTENRRISVNVYLQAIEPGDSIKIDLKALDGLSGEVIPTASFKTGESIRKTTNVLTKYYDDIFKGNLIDSSDNFDINTDDEESDEPPLEESAITKEYEESTDTAWETYEQEIEDNDDEEDED